ncbi:MAG: pyridoxamine 5'-phosphate oxidase [Chloroflexota bacterium]|nr:MAG: pyridoxamine 5'-phosphate oxidase [Chloroflexota bacterium]
MITPNDLQRLENARNLWLATVRPNGAPHLVPIWFVWLDEKAYLCTALDSVKARNIRQNPRVAFALEDGDDPVLMEGTARILENGTPEIVQAFQKKFNWDIRGDGTYNTIIEITPTRMVL